MAGSIGCTDNLFVESITDAIGDQLKVFKWNQLAVHTEDVLHLDEARWSHSQIEQDTFSHSEEDGLHRTHKRHPNGVHSRKGQTKTKKNYNSSLTSSGTPSSHEAA